MKIRTTTQDDADAVRKVYELAFPESERDLVSRLAGELLSAAASSPILSLVAEVDGHVVGHIAFSPVTSRDTREPIGYLLAPLAVCPDHQRRGIGSRLVAEGVKQVAAMGAGVLLVYGDPKYYGRFGFTVDQGKRYTPPYPLQYAYGWQAMSLGEGDSGRPDVAIDCVAAFGHPELW